MRRPLLLLFALSGLLLGLSLLRPSGESLRLLRALMAFCLELSMGGLLFLRGSQLLKLESFGDLKRPARALGLSAGLLALSCSGLYPLRGPWTPNWSSPLNLQLGLLLLLLLLNLPYIEPHQGRPESPLPRFIAGLSPALLLLLAGALSLSLPKQGDLLPLRLLLQGLISAGALLLLIRPKWKHELARLISIYGLALLLLLSLDLFMAWYSGEISALSGSVKISSLALLTQLLWLPKPPLKLLALLLLLGSLGLKVL